MNILKKLAGAAALVVLLVSCSSDDKIVDPSRYHSVDLIGGEIKSADKELRNQRIQIPAAHSTTYWPESGGVAPQTPQNLLVGSGQALTGKIATHQAHPNFDRDYYFTGNTPVIHNNKLFVLGQAKVYAYDIANIKSHLWVKEFVQQKSDENILRGGGLFVTKDYLAVTYGSNHVTLLDSNTGRELWHYELTNISRASPLIHRGKVFVLTIDNKLYCLDLKTGLLKWVYEGISETLSVIRSLALVAHDEMVLVPCSTGQLLLINTDSGELVKNLSTDERVSLVNYIHTPVVSSDIAYVSSFKGTMYAVDLRDGSVEWENLSAGGGAIWLAGDYIFSINKYTQLVAVNKHSGKVKWVQDMSITESFSGPVLVNKELYVTSSKGKLLVFSPLDGSQTREISIPKGKYAQPIAVQGGMFLLAENGKLAVLK